MKPRISFNTLLKDSEDNAEYCYCERPGYAVSKKAYLSGTSTKTKFAVGTINKLIEVGSCRSFRDDAGSSADVKYVFSARASL
jgi:hypothetical protein